MDSVYVKVVMELNKINLKNIIYLSHLGDTGIQIIAKFTYLSYFLQSNLFADLYNTLKNSGRQL